MDALKKIFFNHGEKILLVVIGLLCLSSIYRHVARPKNQLPLPDGKTTEIDQDDLRQKLKKVDDLIKSKDGKREEPEAEKVGAKFATELLAGAASNDRNELQWTAYCRPAPIGIPQAFREAYNPDEKEQGNIPPEFRTRLGNAEDVRVRASYGKIMITARDSQHLNYPLSGSRQMLIYRKAIGSAKDDLDPAIRAVLKESPRAQGLVDDGEGAAASGAAAQPQAAPSAGFNWGAVAAPQRRAETPSSAAAPEYSLEQYKLAINRKDLQADGDLNVITGNDDGLLFDSGWELVTDSMYVVKKGELSEDDVATIFKEGLNPDLVVMSEEQKAEWDKAQEAKAAAAKAAKKAEAPAASLTAGMKSANTRAKPKAIAIKPAQNAAAEEETENAQNQYVFIDDTVKENMIYRYAVLAAVKPRMPEKKEVDMDLGKWDIYCELVGIDKVGSFAPPQRMLRGLIFAEPGKGGQGGQENAAVDEGEETAMTLLPELNLKHERGVMGPTLLKFIRPAYPSAAEIAAAQAAAAPVADGDKEPAKPGKSGAASQDNGPKAKSLRDDGHRLSSLGWAYKNKETCFSDFVCSDLVLTPKKFDFAWVNVLSGDKGGESSARVRVFKIEDNGETYSAEFTVKAPALPRKVEWSDFLAKERNADGKEKFVRPLRVLSLIEVYNKDVLAQVVPTLLGEKKKGELVTAENSQAAAREIARSAMDSQAAADGPAGKRGMPSFPGGGDGAAKAAASAAAKVYSKSEIDFASNWGVIDIRPYKVRQHIYRKDKETGEFVYKQSNDIQTLNAIVIAEIKTAEGVERRVRRLFKPLPSKPETDTTRYAYEYVPEPELEAQLKKQKEKEEAAAKGKAPAPAAGGK